MTLRQAFNRAKEMLAALKDIDDPALESEVLLRNVLKINRAQFFLEQEREISPEEAEKFRQWVQRRLQGEPTAYIIQCREFYGLDFYVDNRVLIPRPETELLVEEAIQFARSHPVKAIADTGTGSGAIAVSLAVNLSSRQVKIFATDLSSAALEVADINCRKHGVSSRVILLQGDLLEPLTGPVDILTANLPYISGADMPGVNTAKFEPELALYGGESGLDKVFRLCDELKDKVNNGGCVLLETGMGQSGAVTGYLHKLFPESEITVLKDLAGIERVVRLVVGEREYQ